MAEKSFDHLADRSRVRGSARVLPEGTAAADVTAEQSRQVAAAVAEYRSRAGLSIADIAKAVGYARSTLYQVLGGKYAGDARQIILDLDRWLEDEQKSAEAPRRVEFVWTQVAQEIKTIADAAVQLRTIGLVYGPDTSGIGKTMTLRALQKEKPGSLLVTIEKVQANTSGLLCAVAEALHISTGHPNRYLFERIKGILAGTPRLLMIDQIHNLCGCLEDRPFYILADLYDATNAPQLWCGTSDIVAYLDRGQARGREPLAQIRRRIGVRRDLMERTRGRGDGGKGEPLYTIEEIRRIFGAGKMRLAPDGARYLWLLACLPDAGGLGICSNIFILSATVAEMRGVNILTADMLRAAHRELVNSRAFAELERHLIAEGRPAIGRRLAG
jgi:DNA transposition AAA+ family ATPase